jgi:hypothetical protein
MWLGVDGGDTSSGDQMNTYIALFRGINVGGNNLLPMNELVVLLTERVFYLHAPEVVGSTARPK